MQIMVNSDQLINASGKIKKLAGYMRINKKDISFCPHYCFLIFTVLQGCAAHGSQSERAASGIE